MSLEYIGVEEDGPVKEREESWLNGGEDEESEEDFEWVGQQVQKDSNKAKAETYFVFVNETREPMKAGTQAWNCYGNRNNEYLLINYGFCFQDNLYDSFTLHLRLDVDIQKGTPASVAEMFAQSGSAVAGRV